MRVVDLDRDMSDVIPTSMSPDSEYLFARMTEATLAATHPAPGLSILDVGSGVGQDSIALAGRGARVVGAEPSGRMTGMAKLFAADKPGQMPNWVRGWADDLPFADDSFDACFCKGALDHFDTPEFAIAEMARVTRPGGYVVLAIANFESLACRVGRWLDDFRQDWLGLPVIRDRRGYDAPSDHFTRYELDLMLEQARRSLTGVETIGVSMGWGMPGWSQGLSKLPQALAARLCEGMDALARRQPTLADVCVIVGHPRP